MIRLTVRRPVVVQRPRGLRGGGCDGRSRLRRWPWGCRTWCGPYRTRAAWLTLRNASAGATKLDTGCLQGPLVNVQLQRKVNSIRVQHFVSICYVFYYFYNLYMNASIFIFRHFYIARFSFHIFRFLCTYINCQKRCRVEFFR